MPDNEEALIPENDANNTALLPSNYWEDTNEADEGAAGDANPTYLGFCNAKSNDNVKQGVLAAGGRPDQFYLMRNGAYIPLQTCTFHLIKSTKVFTAQDGKGKTVGVALEEPVGEKGKNYKPHGVAVVAVKLGDTLVPARFTARSGLFDTLKQARTTLEVAKDIQKFSSSGEAYRIASTCPVAAGRFLVTASASMETSSTSGYDYIKARGTPLPSKLEDVQRFVEATKTPEFNRELAKVDNSYSMVVAKLREQAK